MTVTEALETILLVIGRNEPKILRSLGIDGRESRQLIEAELVLKLHLLPALLAAQKSWPDRPGAKRVRRRAPRPRPRLGPRLVP